MTSGLPKGKTKLSDEELKANKDEYAKKYESNPKRKAWKYKYNRTPAVILRKKKHQDKPEVKAKAKKRSQKPEVKAGQKDTRDGRRLNVLQYFSKLHSNSDIPCCRCCGLNGHIDFLELDHILGKTQMTSIPEIMKLKYRKNFELTQLVYWIIKNNYLSNLKTEYFQILCRNCNFAKGMEKNNNKCPMENKPH